MTQPREIRLYEAMREALTEEMDGDPDTFLIGESIRGGTWPYTKGLSEKFGDRRVVDTPLAETGLAGCAMGAAQEGLRPVVDFMYAGFMYQAGSEVLLQMAQYHFLHGSKRALPVTMIGTCGVGMRVAHEHAIVPHGTLMQHPGLKVCMPSTPYDAKGLLKSAIRDNNPVFFLWHTGLLTAKGHVPEEEYLVPVGKADVKREGSDVTVLTSGLQVRNALEAAKRVADDISVEVIDARSFEPFDLPCLLQSLEKTNQLIVVDEGFERAGFAAEICALVMEHGYDLLDAPVERVCHPNMPVPGGYIDAYTMPTVERIEASIRKLF
ncbi:MAG: transketolase C-terminal domain-containing protein [Pseudomonadota bacterium]